MTSISSLLIHLTKVKIKDIEFKLRHTANPKKDFTRDRVNTFENVLGMMIFRVVKSISVELFSFFSYLGVQEYCSRQAFSKARKKLKHTAFIELNEAHVSNFYKHNKRNLKLFDNKYLLFSTDGSLLQLPESSTIINHFGSWKNNSNKSMPMARAMVIYDVLNEQIISNKISPIDIGETTTFKIQYEDVKTDFPVIHLMDRAYPSFDLCSQITSKGDFFVIRCKKDFCKSLSEFVASDLTDASIILRNSIYWNKKTGKKVTSKFTKPLKVRTLKIPLSENNEEYIITNLWDYDMITIKELYGKRWGVETMYDYLKNTLEIENFSSKTVEGVLQDFYASILCANMIHSIISEAEEELEQDDSNKHQYKINKKAATGVLRDEVIGMLFLRRNVKKKIAILKEAIKKNKIAIVPERNFKRHKMKRSKRKFFFNKKRAL